VVVGVAVVDGAELGGGSELVAGVGTVDGARLPGVTGAVVVAASPPEEHAVAASSSAAVAAVAAAWMTRRTGMRDKGEEVMTTTVKIVVRRVVRQSAHCTKSLLHRSSYPQRGHIRPSDGDVTMARSPAS
jgi:hypothetical protein